MDWDVCGNGVKGQQMKRTRSIWGPVTMQDILDAVDMIALNCPKN
jgi:hypothetical protein